MATLTARPPTEPTQEIRPNLGPQEQALASPADIVILGGAAGGGKTWALLMEPLRHIHRPGFGAVIFRRTFPQITNEGGLWDESRKLYPHVRGTPKQTTLEWVFPSGAKLRFAHLQYEDNKLDWKGAQIPLIEFDQLEDFTEGQFWYLLSRNRSTTAGIRPYVRGTCNPIPEDDPVGGWLHRLLSWWLDEATGLARPERAGVMRWFARINEALYWADSREALVAAHPGSEPKSLAFFPSKLSDNPPLLRADPGYLANLLALPLVERERLLGGNWKIRPAAGLVFNRAWFPIVDAAPVEARRVRAWDKAGTAGAGDFSAGVRMSAVEGCYYVEHAIRGQWSARQRNAIMRQLAESDGMAVEIHLEQEPGSGGKESAEISIQELAGYAVRAQPATGDKVTRAGPLAAQAEAGNVRLVRGPWNEAFLEELHAFPESAWDDQVDAAAAAFNRLARQGADLDVRLLGRPKPNGDAEAAKAAAERARVEAAKALAATVQRQGYYWPGGV